MKEIKMDEWTTELFFFSYQVLLHIFLAENLKQDLWGPLF